MIRSKTSSIKGIRNQGEIFTPAFSSGAYADFFGTYTASGTYNGYTGYKADSGTRGLWYSGSSWLFGKWDSVGGGSGNAFNSGDSICVHDMTSAYGWTYYDWTTGTSPAAGQGLAVKCVEATPAPPTGGPTNGPTDPPTGGPTNGPTDPPTGGPTNGPTTNPPTGGPTVGPTDPPPPDCGKLNGPSGKTTKISA